MNADPNNLDIDYLTSKLIHHIHEFEKASKEWDDADMLLKHKAHGDAVKLRILRRDDLDRGDAYKAVMFHLEAAEMYSGAITAIHSRLAEKRAYVTTPFR